MQATITYLLSEQAQRAQMAATGQPVARKQVLVEDIPVELLDSPLATIAEDGALSFNLTRDIAVTESGRIGWNCYVSGFGQSRAPFDALPPSGAEAVRVRQAAVEAYAAKIRADYEEQTRRREAERASERERDLLRGEQVYQSMLATPTARPNLDDIPDWHPRRAEWDAEIASRKAIDEAAKAANEAAKTAYLRTWVFDHGDESLRAQFSDGLLCRKAALALIAAATFADAGVPEEYADSVVCRNRECPCEDNPIDCLPTEVYARWSAIRKMMPEGSTAEFRRVRDCLRNEDWDGEGDSATDAYYVACIKMPHGPFQFERRVRL